jgi:hypothetical protein
MKRRNLMFGRRSVTTMTFSSEAVMRITRAARAFSYALMVTLAVWSGGSEALTISVTDVAAGQAAFFSSGAIQTEFDWKQAFPAGTTWTVGQTGPRVNFGSQQFTSSDGVTRNTAIGSISLENWIGGPGFEAAGPTALPSLAVNGFEDFTLVFGKGQQNIGLAVTTGMGNDPGQTDANGAFFTVTALDAANNVVDAATFTLDSGADGFRAWLTFTSPIAFETLQFYETGNAEHPRSIEDQYFGNVYSSTQIAEPGTLGLLAFGILLILRARSSTLRS